jgi:hypothetical protein
MITVLDPDETRVGTKLPRNKFAVFGWRRSHLDRRMAAANVWLTSAEEQEGPSCQKN